MSAARMQMFTASDGTELAWHEMGHELGTGRPLLLLHGLFSSAEVNWIKYGHAARIAAAGFRVIMPDLRAHGMSGAPHDPAAYPDDILARDGEELIAHLGLDDFDLGGFSLGARTTVRLLVRGVRPRRVVLAGMGLEGLAGWTGRRDFFLGAIERFELAKRGEPEWMAVQFMKTMRIDRTAARLLLGTFTDTDPAALAELEAPTLVICGEQDNDNGSAARLAAALPDARLTLVPGTHMSSVTVPELGAGIAEFLASDTP